MAKTTGRFASIFFFLLLISCPLLSKAQVEESFTGEWTGKVFTDNEYGAVYFSLSIAAPEREELYPAQLKITCQKFTGVYDFLLVRNIKNELVIGRNKVPLVEEPFSLGAWTVFLNGTFRLRGRGEGSFLAANRIFSKRYGVAMPLLQNFDDTVRGLAMQVRDALQTGEIVLSKSKNVIGNDIHSTKILNPWLSDVYFGIMDSIHLKNSEGRLSFIDNLKIDNDTVAVTLNGKLIIAPTDLSRRSPVELVKLDTGLNILIFFASNYGRIPPNTGKLALAFGNEKFVISFTNPADVSANFIVLKLIYHPEIQGTKINELARNTILIDSFKTSSGKVTLAIWDDAVEDGDSISLNLNGKWVANGFAVRKQPKFLEVKLAPGDNSIIFVADNLGAIAPNTSLLEIIDGKRRKVFSISTDLKKNSQVKITYDYRSLE